MSKKILECQYCKSIITEKDSTCPKCGANCSDVIKQYHKELEEEEKKKQEELSEKATKAAKIVATGFGIHYAVAIIIFIVIVVAFITMAFSFNSSKKQKTTVEGTLNEEIKGQEYSIKIDSFETYEYYDDFFKNCNTKEGYQRVAFHFVIENITDKTISTSNILFHIDLKAEDEVVKQSDLDAETHFCEVIQGKKEYNKLPFTNILAGDKVSGYLGFEIPKSKETLKFVVEDNMIIEMANPVYEREDA